MEENVRFSKIGLILLPLALIVVVATAKDKTYKFDLDLEGLVGGKMLRAGNYRVEIKCSDDGKGNVFFYDGYRLVAKAPCNMIAIEDASDFCGVTYSKNAEGKKVISTIFLKGAKEKVILSAGN